MLIPLLWSLVRLNTLSENFGMLVKSFLLNAPNIDLSYHSLPDVKVKHMSWCQKSSFLKLQLGYSCKRRWIVEEEIGGNDEGEMMEEGKRWSLAIFPIPPLVLILS